ASVADPNIDRGNSDFDIPNSFTAGVTYALPPPGSVLGPNQIVREILRDWSVDAFVLGRSSPSVNIIGAVFNGNGISLYPRPNDLIQLGQNGVSRCLIQKRAGIFSEP